MTKKSPPISVDALSNYVDASREDTANIEKVFELIKNLNEFEARLKEIETVIFGIAKVPGVKGLSAFIDDLDRIVKEIPEDIKDYSRKLEESLSSFKENVCQVRVKETDDKITQLKKTLMDDIQSLRESIENIKTKVIEEMEKRSKKELKRVEGKLDDHAKEVDERIDAITIKTSNLTVKVNLYLWVMGFVGTAIGMVVVEIAKHFLK